MGLKIGVNTPSMCRLDVFIFYSPLNPPSTSRPSNHPFLLVHIPHCFLILQGSPHIFPYQQPFICLRCSSHFATLNCIILISKKKQIIPNSFISFPSFVWSVTPDAAKFVSFFINECLNVISLVAIILLILLYHIYNFLFSFIVYMYVCACMYVYPR